jgi:hypothetical protein
LDTSSVSAAVDSGGGGAATQYEAAGLAGAQLRMAPSLPAASRLPPPVASSARTLQQDCSGITKWQVPV